MSHFYYTNVERKENKSVKLGCIIVVYCASVLVLCGFVLLKNRRAFVAENMGVWHMSVAAGQVQMQI